jgi:hypothetical protein
VYALPVVMVMALLAIACTTSNREERLQEVLRRSRAAPDRIVELETPFLEDADPDVRALAIWAIGDAAAPDAATAVSFLVTDPAPVVRLAVVNALCSVPAREALDAVASLTSDSDVATRRAALRCLARSPSPPLEILDRALSDVDKDVRTTALGAIALHPDRSTLTSLLKVFEARGPDEQIAAVAALRALRDPDALPGLERAAASRLSAPVRDAVEAAILDLRAAAVEEQQAATAPGEGGEGSAADRKGPGTKREAESPEKPKLAPSPNLAAPSAKLDFSTKLAVPSTKMPPSPKPAAPSAKMTPSPKLAAPSARMTASPKGAAPSSKMTASSKGAIPTTKVAPLPKSTGALKNSSPMGGGRDQGPAGATPQRSTRSVVKKTPRKPRLEKNQARKKETGRGQPPAGREKRGDG